MSPRTATAVAGGVLLAAQPWLPLLILCSAFLGLPPLWVSWPLALAPVAWRWKSRGAAFHRTAFDPALLLFGAGLVMGVVVSANKSVSLDAVQTFVACALTYYGITAQGCDRPNYWKWTVAATFAIFLGVALAGLARGLPWSAGLYKEWSPGPVDPATPALAPVHVNAAGTALGMLAPPSLAVAVWPRTAALRTAAAAVFAALLGLLLLSGSAEGWLTAAAGIGAVLLYWRPWALGPMLAAAGGALWLLASYWHPDNWLGRLFSVSSIASRVQLWSGTWQLTSDHPLTGLGLGTWLQHYPFQPYRWVGAPHSAYLQLYADTGVLGLVALVLGGSIFAWLLWRIWRAPRDATFGWKAGVAATVLAGAFNALVENNLSSGIVTATQGGLPYAYRYLAFPFLWLWAGLLVVICRPSPAGQSTLSARSGLPGRTLWLCRVCDWLVPRLSGYQQVGDERSLLRISRRRHRGGSVALQDGTIIKSGDSLCEIHLDNRRTKDLVATATSWDRAVWQVVDQLGTDLAALAENAHSSDIRPLPRAVHGTTVLGAVARRLGFEVTAAESSGPLRWISRLYMRGLLQVFNPAGADRLRKGRSRLEPQAIWMSLPTLVRLYGNVAPSPRSSDTLTSSSPRSAMASSSDGSARSI